jgi:xanthine dehydrogenase YagR molybdenum-binding subunit
MTDLIPELRTPTRPRARAACAAACRVARGRPRQGHRRRQIRGRDPAPDLAYGVVVSGTVAKGRIKTIDTGAAEAVPGVIAVITHENRRSRCAATTSPTRT